MEHRRNTDTFRVSSVASSLFPVPRYRTCATPTTYEGASSMNEITSVNHYKSTGYGDGSDGTVAKKREGVARCATSPRSRGFRTRRKRRG